MNNKLPVLAIIPARMHSQRLKHKMLLNIEGKSLIEWTWINANRCKYIDEILVATDDMELYKHIQGFGANVVLTSNTHLSGSSRIQEVLQIPKYSNFNGIILNIQGDEPCVNPMTMEATIQALIKNPSAVVSTPVVASTNKQDFIDASIVKCVTAATGEALYFSRASIPSSKNPATETKFLQHIGIYAYRAEFIKSFDFSKSTPLRETEDLEQLAILEASHTIQTVLVSETPLGVNIEKDVPEVTQWIKENLYL